MAHQENGGVGMRIDDFQELMGWVNEEYCNQDFLVTFDGREIGCIETPKDGPIVCRMHLTDGKCFNWRDCHVEAASPLSVMGRLDVQELAGCLVQLDSEGTLVEGARGLALV